MKNYSNGTSGTIGTLVYIVLYISALYACSKLLAMALLAQRWSLVVL